MQNLINSISKYVKYFELKESINQEFVLVIPLLKNVRLLFSSKTREHLIARIANLSLPICAIRFFLI